MNEWGVVGVVIALVGLITAVVGPMIKVSSSLTKVTTILDSVTDRLNKLETADKDFQESSQQARDRLYDRINKVEDNAHTLEVRISNLEQVKGGST